MVGASVGAILSPAERIPVKLDDLDPCHNNSRLNKMITSIWEIFKWMKSNLLGRFSDLKYILF